MKGGYQILDLTGATAGSPVEIKGIYKAAAGNNGKPVMILTNDGQRVYAEIAEDDGDYITCYISAEGKTVNINIKSDDSVTTVISDPGASITGLEQAVNELNDNKAAKSDITDLECTGTKNTTGNTIAAGRYFYLNGALCKATADIENGATFTLNTNFAVVTIDEELRALNSNKLNNTFTHLGSISNGQTIDLANYKEFKARPRAGSVFIPIMAVWKSTQSTIFYDPDGYKHWFEFDANSVLTYHTDAGNSACRFDVR